MAALLLRRQRRPWHLLLACLPVLCLLACLVCSSVGLVQIHRHPTYTLYPMRLDDTDRPTPLHVLAQYAPKGWKPKVQRVTVAKTPTGPLIPSATAPVKGPTSDDQDDLPRSHNGGLGAPQLREDLLAAEGVMWFDFVPMAPEEGTHGAPGAAWTDEQLDHDDAPAAPPAAASSRRRADVSVTKLHLWDTFPASSHDALAQHGHIIRLANPHRHFAFQAPVGGCAALAEKGGLEKTTENAKRNKCRVATNAGFFDTTRGVVKRCYNGLVTRGGTFIQKQHTRRKSEQHTRNVHFGLTDHGYFFTGYMSPALWLRHLRPGSQVPKDIDDAPHRDDRAKWQAQRDEQDKKWAEQVEQKRKAAFEEVGVKEFIPAAFNQQRQQLRGKESHTMTTTTTTTVSSNVDPETGRSYTMTTVPKDPSNGNAAQRRLLQQTMKQAHPEQQQQQQPHPHPRSRFMKKCSPILDPTPGADLRPPPMDLYPEDNCRPVEYETLTGRPDDWRFETLLAGVMWLVRDGRDYLNQSIADGEDLSVERSNCDECPKGEREGKEAGTSSRKRDEHFIHLNAARTAIGHTLDGALLILSIDGDGHDVFNHAVGKKADPADLQMPGITLHDLARLMISFGALNAINLDGGGSATVVVDGVVSNYPGDGPDLAHAKEYAWMKRWGDQYGDLANVQHPASDERKVSTITCIYDDDDEADSANGSTTGSQAPSAADPTKIDLLDLELLRRLNASQTLVNLSLALAAQHQLQEQLATALQEKEDAVAERTTAEAEKEDALQAQQAAVQAQGAALADKLAAQTEKEAAQKREQEALAAKDLALKAKDAATLAEQAAEQAKADALRAKEAALKEKDDALRARVDTHLADSTVELEEEMSLTKLRASYDSQLWFSRFFLSLAGLLLLFLSLAFLLYCCRARLTEVKREFRAKRGGFERVGGSAAEEGAIGVEAAQEGVDAADEDDVELPIDDSEDGASPAAALAAPRATRLVARSQLLATSLDDPEDLSIDRRGAAAAAASSALGVSSSPSDSSPILKASASASPVSSLPVAHPVASALASAHWSHRKERKRDAGKDATQTVPLAAAPPPAERKETAQYELGDLPSSSDEEEPDDDDQAAR